MAAGATRRDLFEASERAALKPLPRDPWEWGEWIERKVGPNCHVRIRRNHYSVPERHIGATVHVRVGERMVEIFTAREGERIAVHPLRSGANQYATRPEHMPDRLQAVRDIRSPDWGNILLSQARRIGPLAGAWAERCFASRDFPEQAFATVQGMIRLADDHGADRLETLCGEALDLNRIASGFLRERLKNGIRTPAPRPEVRETIPRHGNIRGGNYYRANQGDTPMTLRQPNVERMLQLGLHGMVEVLEEQRDIADIDQLGFDDRLAMMIEREAQYRDHKSYLGHLRQAQLRIRADLQDVDCRAGRGITRNHADRTRRRRLDPPGLQPDPHRSNRIRKDLPGLRPGPSGMPAEGIRALPARARTRLRARPRPRQGITPPPHAATRQGLATAARRLGTAGLLHREPPRPARDRRATPRPGLPADRQSDPRGSNWPRVIAEATIADAILDRIVHNAYRIEITGESPAQAQPAAAPGRRIRGDSSWP